jgi:hypothetical protein
MIDNRIIKNKLQLRTEDVSDFGRAVCEELAIFDLQKRTQCAHGGELLRRKLLTASEACDAVLQQQIETLSGEPGLTSKPEALNDLFVEGVVRRAGREMCR